MCGEVEKSAARHFLICLTIRGEFKHRGTVKVKKKSMVDVSTDLSTDNTVPLDPSRNEVPARKKKIQSYQIKTLCGNMYKSLKTILNRMRLSLYEFLT